MAVMRTTKVTVCGTAAGVLLALGAGLVQPAVAADHADKLIANAGQPGVIKDSYIVTFKSDRLNVRSPKAKDLASHFGARVVRTFGSALNGYSVKVTEQQARRFAQDPAVQSVVQDQVVSASATQPSPPSWGLDRIDQPSLPLDSRYVYPDSAGGGVTAYIIDTGVRISHQDFGGRASYGYDFVDNDAVADDGNGHGTHVAANVAGTAHGVAKNTKIVAVRVLNNSGSGTLTGVIAGIDWVTQNAVKPAVANMSLGGGGNTALDDAVRNSIASGVTYAVAAGNSNANAANYSPARVAEAITVGATADTDSRSSFSNWGTSLDIFAPGTAITSAWNTGDSATNTISGTSMAAPHVTGAAALYLADHPAALPTEVAAALTSTATAGVVGNPGTGSPNRLLRVMPPVAPPARFENATDYPISDFVTTESPIKVAGVSGNAPSGLRVSVDIKHTYIGDLQIDLVAPDGSVYTLKKAGAGGSADNVLASYLVNASSEAANGTWKLRVRDSAMFDRGKIDSWSLRF
ncbi:S8 family peptidase [Streptomyces sp. NBC_01077]|uniref:S8 family peptidase n=1 Tax=Streptomyces sp. NBC_01077 TaxID=2903746 RepID=UPI00386D0ACA|nr:S8 family peptidase [Streptomyces sp. NBC_01077]WSV43664.1 S8 family peptidase [Streptomyces sp. NBC_01077]